MPIQFQCTWCGKKINAGDAFAGKSAKCPGCGGVVQVPAATEPPPAAVSAGVVRNLSVMRSSRPAVSTHPE